MTRRALSLPDLEYGQCQCGCPLDGDGCPDCQPGPDRGRKPVMVRESTPTLARDFPPFSPEYNDYWD